MDEIIGPEEIAVFLEEAEEQLQLMEENVLRMEEEGAAPDLLDEIFRAAHTLKGSAATLGYSRMAELAHGLEELLDGLRKGRLAVGTEVIQALLDGLDFLRSMLNEIAEGKGEVDFPGVDKATGRIRALVEAVSAAEGQAAAGAGAAAGSGSRPKPEPSAPARPEPGPGAAEVQGALYQVSVKIAADCLMPAVRAFQVVMALDELGQIVASDPTLEEIEDEKVKDTLTVQVRTRAAEGELEEKLAGIADLDRIEISRVAVADGVDSEVYPDEGGLSSFSGGSPSPSPDEGSGESRVRRTVRVDVGVLDNLLNLVGELVIDRTRLEQVCRNLRVLEGTGELTQDLDRLTANIGRTTDLLQESIMKARMLPIEVLFRKFPRLVRDLGRDLGKEVEFMMLGQDTELDRSVLEEIGDPLIHLLRNSIDHGLEPPREREAAGKPRKGRVVLSARHEENQMVITVEDDGRGIDTEKVKKLAVEKGILPPDVAERSTRDELLATVFYPGFSTAGQVSEVSGRGVGLDVVKKNIEKLNGSVQVETWLGKGTRFTIRLPLTLAIIRALLVRCEGEVYAIPLSSVVETVCPDKDQVETVAGRPVLVLRDEVLPLVSLAQLFGLGQASYTEPGAQEDQEHYVVLVRVSGRTFGLVVDALVGEQEVVIKGLGEFLNDIPGFSGATILGDGGVALILDVPGLLSSPNMGAVGEG